MRVALALTSVALCAGCAAQGDLAFVSEVIDFGPALPGVERVERVQLVNRSAAQLILDRVQSSSETFTISLPARRDIDPGETRWLDVRHRPPAGATEEQSAELQVWTKEGLVAKVLATSVPTVPECALPAEVEFGMLTTGESLTLELPLRNSTGRASGAMLGTLLATHSAFQVASGWIPLGPGEEVPVQITFSPSSFRGYTAALPVRRHPLCAEQLVRLKGDGASTVLTFGPAALSFSSQVGTSEVQALTLRNSSLAPIALAGISVRDGAIVSPYFRATRFPIRVPPAQGDVPGEATIEVTFTPLNTGSRFAQLLIGTDRPTQQLIVIPLAGSGF